MQRKSPGRQNTRTPSTYILAYSCLTGIEDDKTKSEAKLSCLSMKKRKLNNTYVSYQLPPTIYPNMSNAVKAKHKGKQATRDTGPYEEQPKFTF
ncbi:hypothetical protein VNO80_07887 [Phaseolus coccineus]|uniref:Uncharacterized protein n=1 Tax=Phaseolus coccineus TaxID=3886 RepID=A0AAN9NKH5_PHACN